VSIALILKLCITVLGLTLPGYALARALRLTNSLAAAFPFSALLISQLVVLLAALEASISVATIAPPLTGFTMLFALIDLRRRPATVPEQEHPKEEELPTVPLLLKLSIFAAFAMVAAVAFRTTIYPLGGFDTFTRWDALARAMLKYGSLSFYPPVTPDDFSRYFVPDGFPPLVASIYWWIYAASGSTLPQVTSISVTLQMAAILGLTYGAAKNAFGQTAACFSLLLLLGAPLLVTSVEIGQETGFLALAVAGQICYALAAIRRPAISPVIAAALFAALGAQAREYGPALALPGLLLLLSGTNSRRLAWKYLLLVAAFASPWYLRNWDVTGNPLFPHALPGGLPTNKVVVAVLRYYGEFLSPSNFTMTQWLAIGYDIACGAMLALIGLPYMIGNVRSFFPYLVPVALITALWFWSIGQTSGGVQYSMRVLVPAIVILAIAGGAACSRLVGAWQRHRFPQAIAVFILIFAGYGLLTALAYPLTPDKIADSIFSTKTELPEFTTAHAELVAQIKGTKTPPTGILMDSSYLAIMLTRETSFRPVMIWNPEVDFIFNPTASGEDVRRRLVRMDIRLVAVSKTSVHNDFLFRTSFYRDGYQSWTPLLFAGDSYVLLELPAESPEDKPLKRMAP